MLDDTSRAYITAATHGDTAETDRLAAVLDVATKLNHARDDDPDRIITAALAYAAAGVPVFPIAARGKRPLTGHGFKDATTDRAQVQAWWLRWPDANVGVPTGVAFDVVDVDGADGIAALYNGTRPVVDSLTVLGVALTSRDGGRHIYVPPAGIGNGTNLWPGVDYRGAGGYVVAPPSIGANGQRYQWLTEPDFATMRATAEPAA